MSPDTNPLPLWLTNALREGASPPVAREAAGGPNAGDIWLATSLEDQEPVRRLVCLLDGQEESGLWTIGLVSNVTEAATDRDVLLDAPVTGVPFSVLIECDVTGPIWNSQLLWRVGRISGELTTRIMSTGNDLYDLLSSESRGLPIRGSEDPRLAFKEAEVDSLHRLSKACLTYLLDSPGQSEADPAFLLPELLTQEDLVSFLELIRAESVTVPADCVWDLISDPRYCESWQRRFGWDAWNAIQPLLQPKDSEEINGDTPGDPLGIQGRVDDESTRLLLRHIDRSVRNGRHTVRVVSPLRCWQGESHDRSFATVRASGGPIAHIIVQPPPKVSLLA